ncbi:hypothetical protein [Roseobacter sp. CCS2]|uniref:hypothetical protein n=1 Tax=Roseobacter sp. CCS2 TaxID=391593 RepID=UPI0000F3E28A|nr:hypothetical protein [Roseobacter sp. CCS2]EBA12646.1 hypothetical protein RCCS2_15154 [Roseobacter sp. CCS2]
MPSYSINSKDFVIESFDSDFIFLDQRDGKYYEAAEKVADLFRALSTRICPMTLLNTLAERDKNIAKEVSEVMTKMQVLGVISLAEDQEGIVEDIDMVAATMLGEGDFVLEGFAELSSFMLADPVHDIDATTGRFVWGEQVAD